MHRLPLPLRATTAAYSVLVLALAVSVGPADAATHARGRVATTASSTCNPYQGCAPAPGPCGFHHCII